MLILAGAPGDGDGAGTDGASLKTLGTSARPGASHRDLLAGCRSRCEVAIDYLRRVLGQIAGVHGRDEAAGEVRVVPGALGFPVVPVVFVL